MYVDATLEDFYDRLDNLKIVKILYTVQDRKKSCGLYKIYRNYGIFYNYSQYYSW